MKKRIFTFFVLTICVLTIGVQAMELRGITAKPRISFNGTTAICTAACYGDHSDDVINATLTLYQGSTYVDSWSSSGVESVSVRGTSKVKSGKLHTYADLFHQWNRATICFSHSNLPMKKVKDGSAYADPRGCIPLG